MRFSKWFSDRYILWTYSNKQTNANTHIHDNVYSDKMFAQPGIDVNMTDTNSYTALSWAAAWADKKDVHFLEVRDFINMYFKHYTNTYIFQIHCLTGARQPPQDQAESAGQRRVHCTWQGGRDGEVGPLCLPQALNQALRR